MVSAAIPDNYDGREQTWIKHQLLESYLEKLLLIIGMAARQSGTVEICYVDCFAGPWGDDTDDLEGTSIAISLRTMAKCKQKLAKLGVQATMRALYVELDKKAFTRLASHLQDCTPAGVDARCMHGDFLDLRLDIINWCGATAFAFFFIDPKGWKVVGIENLRPLLVRPRSEFLINFIYDFINRTASMAQWQQDIADFLAMPASSVGELVGESPTTREGRLLGSYRNGLKKVLPAGRRSRYKPRTAYVRVMDRKKERPKYHLVYLTTHPKGIIEFMGISQTVEQIQQRVRATQRSERRLEQTGVTDMFADDAAEPHQLQAANGSVVDQFWLRFLSLTPTVIDEDIYSDILEQTDWTPGDLQASLVRLIDSGAVLNLDATSRRPSRPLHYESRERLVLRSGS